MSRPAVSRGVSDDPTHPAWMEVNLDALMHNYRLIRSLVTPETHVIASVKGNGYGVGIVDTARVLQGLGVYAIATGSFRDAMTVREAGIAIKIHMFP